METQPILSNGPSEAEVATLLERLRAVQGRYAEAVDGADDDALHHRPAAGEWSAVEVIAHIGDLDLFNRTQRYNAILMEDQPQLPAYDPDLRIAEGQYGDMTTLDALAFLKRERDSILMLFEGLRPHEWARVGMHPERGPQTLFQLASGLPGHDEMHLGQVAAAMGSARA